MGCMRSRGCIRLTAFFVALTFKRGWSGNEDSDRAALLEWRDTVTNWPDFKTSNSLYGWDSTSPPCTWTGVQCSSLGRVTGLLLPCPPDRCPVKAEGNFSAALWDLDQLQALVLGNQSFSGELASGLGTETFPQNLQLIDLSGNQLSGSLPSSWGTNRTLPGIQQLFLARNQFSGNLPPSWGNKHNWQQLLALNLHSNELTGILPGEWGSSGSFPLLKDLKLDNNKLSGGIPMSWASNESFPRLETLHMQNNFLSGPLSSWDHIGGLRALRALILSHNSLHGSLPNGWGAPDVFQQLLTLSLDNNMITGTLPAEWGRQGAFPLLQTLWLTHNFIASSLPASWGIAGAFPSLRSLRIDRNRLNGSMPEQWGQSAGFLKLQELRLDYNGLSGQLPASWGSKGAFRSLRELLLHGNALTGELPADWGLPGRFLDLRVVALHWNVLHGHLPASWARLPSLQSAWVRPGNYQLCGKLPQQAGFALCQITTNSTKCTPVDDLGNTCNLEYPMQGMLGPANVTSPTLEAVVRLTGTNILPLTPNEIATLTGAVASCLNQVPQQDVYIVQVAQVLQPEVDQISPPVSAPAPSALFPVLPPSSGAMPHRESFATLMGRRRMQGETTPGVTPYEPIAADITIRVTAPDVQHLTTIEDSLVEMVKGTVIQQSMEKYGVNITKVQLLSTMPLEPEVFIPSASVTHNPIPYVQPPQPTPPAVLQSTSPTGMHKRNEAVGIAVGVVVGSILMVFALYTFTVRLRNRKWSEVVGEAEQSTPSLQSPLKSDVSSEDQKPQNKTDSARSDQLLGLRSASHSTKSPHTPGKTGGHAPNKWCHVRANYGGPATTAVSNIPGSGVSREDICLWSPPAGPPPGHQEEQDSDEEFENGDRIMRSQMASTSCGIELPQVPLSDWLIRSEEIVICRRPDGSLYELGTGAFGKVYKAIRGEVQNVAIKVLKNKEEHATFGREIAILKNCRHPNIVQFQGACEKDGQIMLVTEFMESGDLFRALQKKVMQGPNKWSKCGQRIALDIARGLCYLHDKKIVHLDLKSNNILLSRDGTAKIADVGLSRVLTGAYLSNPDVRGTMAYSAPELLMGGKCCEKADIYSLGVVFWEIATNERPIRGQLREVKCDPLIKGYEMISTS
eukprot:jgi/Botrbrau1/10539/Bobra.7_1s0018.2